MSTLHTATSSPTTKALTERSPNTSSPTKSQNTKLNYTKSSAAATVTAMEDLSDSKTTETMQSTTTTSTTSQPQSQSYHSPSDNILSPTSKKLSEIKGKRFASGKPQSLFAKTVRKEGLKRGEVV